MITIKKYCTQAALWGCLCLVSLSVGCCTEDTPEQDKIIVNEAGVVVSKLPIWEKDVSERGYIEVSVTPIFHDGKVIVPGALYDKSGMLVALDTGSGQEVWRWSDYVDGYNFNVLSREELNSRGNLVIYNDNNLFCAVNLDDGTTLWTDVRPGSSHSNAIQIVGDHYYYPYELEEDGVKAQVLMRGDLFFSDYEMVVEAPIEPIQLFRGFYGGLKQHLVYNEGNKIFAFLAFSENFDLYEGKNFNSYVSYNVSDQAFTAQKVRLPDTASAGVVNKPVRIGDVYVITAGDYIYGIDQSTSEIRWSRKNFMGEQSDGGFIAASYKDRLFAVNETGSRSLTMELDPFTGETQWVDEGNGGSTRPALYFLNDVLYFVSRGDERLYAYDVNSGEMLWKLQSPDHEGFTVMQVKKGNASDEADILVACTWKNAYRFEPAR